LYLEKVAIDTKQQQIIIPVDAHQKKFWQSVPEGHRKRIFEKALTAFLLEQKLY